MLQLKLGLKRSIFLFDEKTGTKIRVRLLNILPENMIEIGFDAPKDIRILRDALYYRNLKETSDQKEISDSDLQRPSESSESTV